MFTRFLTSAESLRRSILPRLNATAAVREPAPPRPVNGTTHVFSEPYP